MDDWPSFLFGAIIGGTLMLVLTLRRRRREAKQGALGAPPAPLPEISPEIRSSVLKMISVDLKTAKDIVERMR
jgi:hypothetical protein